MSAILTSEKRYSRFKGMLRLFWGSCPRCNSDAPAVYNCNVCARLYDKSDGNEVANYRQQYPPSPATKSLWWHNWLHPNRGMNRVHVGSIKNGDGEGYVKFPSLPNGAQIYAEW